MDYLEQIQLGVRAGLELGVSRFQVTLTTRPRCLILDGYLYTRGRIICLDERCCPIIRL